jgi:hypothetical protein
MNIYQKVLCDRHPLQEMTPIELKDRLRPNEDPSGGFRCPQCSRIYVFAQNGGYLNFANDPLICNPDQFRCAIHNFPLFLESFEFNGDASCRKWKCPYDGCLEEKVKIGEAAA